MTTAVRRRRQTADLVSGLPLAFLDALRLWQENARNNRLEQPAGAEDVRVNGISPR